MEDDPDALTLNLIYRRSYGLASNLIERRRVGPNAPGRDPATLMARLLADVAREMGTTDAGREAREAIADGVADALEGRRPRWCGLPWRPCKRSRRRQRAAAT